MFKYIKDLKAGDIVCYLGARFRILHDAKESQAHRPQSSHLTTAHGPSDCAWALGEWIEGETIAGYFGPSESPWNFQGNNRAGRYRVL
jgi:hypothetical protein